MSLPMTTFPEPFNPEKEASTCPHREEEKKARRKEENQEGKKCATAVEICQSCKFYVAPRGGSHREPCHRVADGGRPANTHLFDGCMQP